MIKRPPPPLTPNFYAAGPLDRAHLRRTDAAWLAERLADPMTRIVPVWRVRNLVRRAERPEPVTLTVEQARELLRDGMEPMFLGQVETSAYFAIDLPHEDEPAVADEAAFDDLRAVGPLLGRHDGAVLAYARALAQWHARHQYCGACGAKTEARDAGHVRVCTSQGCGISHFPRTDPAVIMLVYDGERILLGRQSIWPPGMHSVLAGFVEPGESLEDAVAREVEEEVGIKITDVHYHSSQPWPFPSSIMLGFWARAATTDIQVDKDELESARWMTIEQVMASPEDETFKLPRKDSIARRLIEDWLAEHGG